MARIPEAPQTSRVPPYSLTFIRKSALVYNLHAYTGVILPYRTPRDKNNASFIIGRLNSLEAFIRAEKLAIADLIELAQRMKKP